MPQTTVDYEALEREFIISDISLRAMARREKMKSNSPLSDYARKHNWAEKRAEYQHRELDRYIQTSAEKNAKRLVRLADLTVDVLEGQLQLYAHQLTAHLDDDGNPVEGRDPQYISPQDAEKTIRLIRELAGTSNRPNGEENAGDGGNLTIHLGADLLAAVGDLARGSLLAGRVAAARPVALPGGAAGDSGRIEEGESA